MTAFDHVLPRFLREEVAQGGDKARGPLEELRCGRMLARDFAVHPAPGEPGQVLIPTGCTLERIRERR